MRLLYKIFFTPSLPSDLLWRRIRWLGVSEIPVFGGIASFTGFGRVQDVYQFTRSDVVVADVRVFRCKTRQRRVEGSHARSEKHAAVAFDRAVGVQLDSHPIRGSSDGDLAIHPALKPIQGGRIGAGQIAVFDSGE